MRLSTAPGPQRHRVLIWHFLLSVFPEPTHDTLALRIGHHDSMVHIAAHNEDERTTLGQDVLSEARVLTSIRAVAYLVRGEDPKAPTVSCIPVPVEVQDE